MIAPGPRLYYLALLLLTAGAAHAGQDDERPLNKGAAPADPHAALRLKAPASVDYAPGKLITVTAEGAARVAWTVFTVPDGPLDSVPSDTALVLAMPAPGAVVYVVASADGPVSAKAVIRVGGGAPGPGPDPKPPAPGRTRFLTILSDGPTLPAALRALAESASLRTACGARQVRLGTLDGKGADAQRLGFAGFPLPGIVLQAADGTVLPDGKPAPLAADATEALLLGLVDAANAGGQK